MKLKFSYAKNNFIDGFKLTQTKNYDHIGVKLFEILNRYKTM